MAYLQPGTRTVPATLLPSLRPGLLGVIGLCPATGYVLTCASCTAAAAAPGHQLHFDSDDEGQGGVRHPIVTAIVYLSDNTSPAQRQGTCHQSNGNNVSNGYSNNPDSSSKHDTTQGSTCSCHGSGCAGQAGRCDCRQQDWVGGPTLMTDQVLGGPLATQGWLAYPATNRVVFFDGRYLHGEWPMQPYSRSSLGCGKQTQTRGLRLGRAMLATTM